MTTTNNESPEAEMVRCTLCPTPVWMRKDRLEKHIAKVHSQTAPSKKTFSSYHARLESTSLARKKSPNPAESNTRLRGKSSNLKLISRDGHRAGPGRCAECGFEQSQLWQYAESNHGPVEICSGCKPLVFERSFGAVEADSVD